MSVSHVSEYLDKLKNCFDSISEESISTIAGTIHAAYVGGKNVFVLGNGGSASTASHFVCDLSKGTAIDGKPRLKAISLTDNVALITAISNDIDYDYVFREQLITFLNEGDVVICISASGNSPNVLEAASYARSKNAISIGLIGFGGGKLKGLVDQAIVFNSTDYGPVEDSQLILGHIISIEVDRRIRGAQL